MSSSLSKLVLCLLLSISSLAAQTGKITGIVKEAGSNEPLVSANVVIEGTTIGAAANVDGFFVILNVPPGLYNVRASMMGYNPVTISNVRVNINQTTNLDFELRQVVLETQEIVVEASRPIVERDVSSSRVNITAREVENLPVFSVVSVIGLQAGIQGMQVRGGGSDQTAFLVNGLTLRDERNNLPYTAISLLSIQDIQIQTGGFNAEYGNARSGVVNVITKDGGQRYNVGAVIRFSPPTRKYFGMTPNNPNSYWIRPYVDPAVAFTGTADDPARGYVSPWDPWTQAQYRRFEGWNLISQKLMADNDPTNDLTPEAAQRVFMWQHRKSFDITKPDYDIDFGFGGPVPVLNAMIGKMRFYYSYRQSSTQYAIPLSRDAYSDFNHKLTVTSDVGIGMKLMIEGLMGRNEAVDWNQTGTYGSFSEPWTIGERMNRVSFIDSRLFTNDYWAPNAVERQMMGAKFTHVLNPSTFYEVSAQRFYSSYSTAPGRMRDTSRVYKFGNNYYLDEAPFGFFPSPENYSTTGIDGLRMAIGMSNARDTSKTTRYQIKFDISSQVDKYNELKAGFEYVYVDNAVNYGSVDLVLPSGRSTSKWQTYPRRLAAYVQDKLEFEGMIANFGLRYEMSHAGGDWYEYDPYTKVFRGAQSQNIDTLLKRVPTQKIDALSPRLGVSFPITENAKLFFNYGHFRDIPLPESLFLVRRETASQDIIRLANPNLPLEKTVAYELGYEHNLFDMFLLRVASYYKNISDQSRLVNYIGYNNVPNYSVTTNTSYEDIRGFEITMTKNRGNWVQGFVNYTYMVSTSGEFGRPRYYQNPVEQRSDERTNPVQTRPVPRPYARANIDFFSPPDYGPNVLGIRPLGDLRLNILGSWRSGFYFTWVGGGSVPGVQYNTKWNDTYGLDIRVSKNLSFGALNIQFFMDMYNVLNLKQLTTYGFIDGTDYENYLKSLHLSTAFNQWYGNIPGDDNPGDYRKAGVAYQPMVYAASLTSVTSPSPVPFYYDASTKQYYQWSNNQWQLVDQGRLDKVLESKAYIDMPNQDWLNFLNPRNVFFGLRISYQL